MFTWSFSDPHKTDTQAFGQSYRASQLPKSAFRPNSNTNNNKSPAHSMPRPDFHSSAPSHCALGKGIWGTEEQEEKQSGQDFNLRLTALLCPSLLQPKSQRTSSVPLSLNLFCLLNTKGCIRQPELPLQWLPAHRAEQAGSAEMFGVEQWSTPSQPIRTKRTRTSDHPRNDLFFIPLLL